MYRLEFLKKADGIMYLDDRVRRIISCDFAFYFRSNVVMMVHIIIIRHVLSLPSTRIKHLIYDA